MPAVAPEIRTNIWRFDFSAVNAPARRDTREKKPSVWKFGGKGSRVSDDLHAGTAE